MEQKPAKVPFDSLTLFAVTAELHALLPGGQVQDIRQPAPTELQFGIRSRGRNFLLALSCDARFARVHLTATRQPNAPTPPHFCMVLRKHLEDGVILAVRQRDFDRIFEMDVEGHNVEGEPYRVTLVAELMGKHSNLILLNDNGIILDSAKRITHRINRLRETLPGLPYLPPPTPTGRVNPFAPDALQYVLRRVNVTEKMGDVELSARLMDTFTGLSPFLVQELVTRALAQGTDIQSGLQAAWEIFAHAAQGDFAPVEIVARGKHMGAYPFPCVQLPQELQHSTENLNFALDDAYTDQRSQADFEAVAGELNGQIEREIKRLERQREATERALLEADRAEQHKQTGELILANLWRLQPGDASITVQDYYDPALPERTIPLDPKLSPQENADAFFRRYRKARDGQETALGFAVKIEESLKTLAAAQTHLTRLEAGQPEATEAVQTLRETLRARGLLHRSQSGPEEEGAESGPDFQGHKIRRYTTPEGYEIYLGETATANDFLTTRIAGPNDLWLHVRAATSAHVVIRTKGQPEIPRSVLERAARLCAQHSAQKHSSLVPVDYTLKKYVRKPRGAAPGSVDYQREKTLNIMP